MLDYLRNNRPVYGNFYLCTVGIDIYEHSNYPKLNSSVKDSKDLKQILIQRYLFSEENSFSLFDEEATGDRILKLFGKVKKTVTKEDHLLFFFSGHGQYSNDRSTGNWVPYNGNPNYPSSLLSNAQILESLSSINAKNILLISHSCFSGSIDKIERFKSVENSIERFLDRNSKSRWIISSTYMEDVEDGNPNQNSPFGECLISHLANQEKQYLSIYYLVNELRKKAGLKSIRQIVAKRRTDLGDNGGEFLLIERDFSKIFSKNANIFVNYGGNLVREKPENSEKIFDITYDDVYNYLVDFGHTKYGKLELALRDRSDKFWKIMELKKPRPIESFAFKVLFVQLKSIRNHKSTINTFRNNLSPMALRDNHYFKHSKSAFEDLGYDCKKYHDGLLGLEGTIPIKITLEKTEALKRSGIEVIGELDSLRRKALRNKDVSRDIRTFNRSLSNLEKRLDQVESMLQKKVRSVINEIPYNRN